MKYLTYLATLLLAAAVCLGQQTVTAERYLVASGHELATKAGTDVLEAGGNAMDAAVTVSMALGVAEPYGSGLGGKLIMLYYDAETRQVHCVEALCVSAGGLNTEAFLALDRGERNSGYRSVAVPGIVAGLHAAFEKWGTGDWAELFEPAAKLAEAGVPLSELSRQMFAPKVSALRADAGAAAEYLVNNDLPETGAVLRHKDLAATLRAIGRGGPDAFYRGELTEKIVAAARAHGSDLTLKDFDDYRPQFTEPLAADYKGGTVYSSPPPLTGGITALMTLKALEAHDWAGFTARDARTLDRIGCVLREVYPLVTRDIGDHEDVHDRALALLNNQNIMGIYQRSLSRSAVSPADTEQAKPAPAGVGIADGKWDEASTTHFVIKDARGNWVSATQSLSYHFGACVVVPGTGMLLNNSLSNFATASEDSVNILGAGKRARSTVAPILMLRDGEPLLAMGIPGGQRIPTTTVQLMLDMLEFGASPAQAFDMPRYHLRRSRYATEPENQFDLEEGSPAGLAQSLREMGWAVQMQERDGTYFGGGNAAVALPDGRTMGIADTRRTNFAGGK